MSQFEDSDVRRSITLKLLLVVFSIYLVVTAVITSIQIYVDVQYQQEQVTHELQAIERLLTPQLIKAIRANDETKIRDLINNAKQSPLLLELNLSLKQKYQKISPQKSMENHQLIGFESFLEKKLAQLIARPVLHHVELKHPQNSHKASSYLGHAVLISDIAVATPALLARIKIILLNAFVLCVMLWIFFMMAGRHYLSKPLKKLTRAVERVASGHYQIAKIEINEHSQSEVDILARAFNIMIDRVTKGQRLLQSTKQHLSNIIDSSPAIIVAVDRLGNITDWNVKAESFFRVARLQALGKRYSQAMPMMQEHDEILQVCLRQQKPKTVSHVRMVKADRVYILDIVLYPLIENALVTGVVVRIDDVTTQKQLEDAVVQSEKMGSVGRLAAGMAHEINNPLGAILQSTQNIERRLRADNKKNMEIAQKYQVDLANVHNYLLERDIIKFLQGIRESGQRAANIVANLLRFSRKSEPQFSAVDINQCLDKALDLVQTDYNLNSKLDVKHILFERQYDLELPQVLCEPTEIQQVFINILINAAQAFNVPSCADQEKIIGITTSHNADWVIIEIYDNGPGMSEEVSGKIFEPFFSTKAVGEGTGLGLAVTYHIVTDNHRGEMQVKSKLAQGSTFEIKLPR